MITLPTNTHIWIAAGVTDLRRGFTGLSALVQTALEQDPGFVYLPNAWSADASCGRRRRAARCR